MSVRARVRSPLSRRMVRAAVELTQDDPDRSVTVEAIVKRLRLPRDEATVCAMAEAINRGWLIHNPGDALHTLKVGPEWRDRLN